MAAGITQVNKPKTHGDKRDAGNAADRPELLISSAEDLQLHQSTTS